MDNIAKDTVSRQSIFDMLDRIQADIEEGDGFDYDKYREEAEELPPVDAQLYETERNRIIEIIKGMRKDFGKDYVSVKGDKDGELIVQAKVVALGQVLDAIGYKEDAESLPNTLGNT